MKRVGILAIVCALSGCLLPTLLLAQLRVIPEFGMDWSPSDLGEASPNGVPRTYETEAPLQSSLSVSGFPATGWIRFRISGVQCLKADVAVDYRAGCTSTYCDLPTRIRALSAAVVLSDSFFRSSLTTYLMLGGGAKRWDFAFPGGSQISGLFSNSSTFVAANWDFLGSSTQYSLCPKLVSRSPVEKRLRQHDILVTVGLAYDLRMPLT